MESPAKPEVRVRGVQPDDIDFLCEFLQSGFSKSGIPAAGWRALFDYTWRPDSSDPGLVLTVDGAIVGFLGTICVCRELRGKSVLLCNCSSWYVRPEHRNLSLALLSAAHRDRRLTYTNFTPNSLTVQMLKRMGFRPLAARRFILPPLSNAETLLAPPPLISFAPETVYRLIDESQRRIFDDHARYDCLQGVVVDGKDHAYLVAKRRLWRLRPMTRLLAAGAGLPYSLLLHCSAPAILARHLERIKLALLVQQRTVLLAADEHVFPTPPRGFHRTKPTWYRSDDLHPGDLDGLYSELVLLPL